MSAFQNNGSGTLKSQTIEGAVLELSYAVQAAETAQVKAGKIDANNISISFNSESNTASISYQIPLTPIVVGGKVQLAAVDYISVPGAEFAFAKGDTSLESTFLAPALWELLNKASLLETTVNNIGVSADIDNKVGSVSVNLPIALTVGNDGALKIAAAVYLP